MALHLSTRIIAAASLLAVGLIGFSAASHTGEISVHTAGLEVRLSQNSDKDQSALTIKQEQCPPTCPVFNISWKKYADPANATNLSFLS